MESARTGPLACARQGAEAPPDTTKPRAMHVAGTVVDLVGVIGANVLADVLLDPPDPRQTRMIKSSNSKYQAAARISTGAASKPPSASTS